MGGRAALFVTNVGRSPIAAAASQGLPIELFWILDDITPLRDPAETAAGPKLFAPRTTIRTKLHFGALRNVGSGISFAVASGIGGGIRSFERPDGTPGREYLDVGENPPNGAIIYYRLDDSPSDPLTLTFRDASGQPIIGFRSDDASLPAQRRPTTRPGLNRFVWDLKYPGPAKLDPALAPPRNKPLAKDADPTPGPTVVPGDYQVERTTGRALGHAYGGGAQFFSMWVVGDEKPTS